MAQVKRMAQEPVVQEVLLVLVLLCIQEAMEVVDMTEDRLMMVVVVVVARAQLKTGRMD